MFRALAKFCARLIRQKPDFTRFAYGLLAVHAALLAWHAAANCPVTTELGHLPAGISHWKFGRFELYRQNPPLVRMVAALPVLAVRHEENWTGYGSSPHARAEAVVGRSFARANGNRTPFLFALARFACIPFSLVGAWVAWRWAAELYGPSAGLLALVLYCFCPNLVGHGALVMPDAPASAMALAAGYTFWRWLKTPTWETAVLSGVVLGLAELTKTTLVVMLPVWPALWIVYRLADGRRTNARTWLREAGLVALRLVVAWYVLNSMYLFTGTLKQLRDYEFRSRLFRGIAADAPDERRPGNRFANSWLGRAPALLPTDYVQGIDLQRDDFEIKMLWSYLRGQGQSGGWWYYYVYVLAVKLPAGTLILIGLAAALTLARKCSALWLDELVLLAPAVAIFALVSSQTGFSVHGRYIWPVLGFLFVLAGKSACLIGRGRPYASVLVLGAALWNVSSMLWHSPHSLSYFNELAGGPRSGHFHLLDSNISWGQDMGRLKAWIDDHPDARPIYVLVGHGVDAAVVGISAPLPPFVQGDKEAGGQSANQPRDKRAQEDLPYGYYAIDVNYLRGPGIAPYYSNGPYPRFHERAKSILTGLLEVKPVAMVGYSIYIYRLGGPESED